MISVGLVLGAGGVTGGAFHAGVLGALADATGWDPRLADLIVGTSAGANTAASLRGGLSAADHLARGTGGDLSAEGDALTAESPGPLRLPMSANGLRAPWDYRPQAPWLLAPAFLRPGPPRLGVALAGLLPAGRIPTDMIGERVRSLHRDRWPQAPTWIVAYRTGDARRIVFGRDDVDVPDLATAVEASSAVPGRFKPVTVGAGRYIDGAVHSPTNADLVATLAFDLVIVSSPMSAAPTGDERGPRAARPREWFARVLAREIAAVASRGTPVLCFEPSPLDLAAAGTDLADDERLPLVTGSAYRSALATLERADDGAIDTARGLLRQLA